MEVVVLRQRRRGGGDGGGGVEAEAEAEMEVVVLRQRRRGGGDGGGGVEANAEAEMVVLVLRQRRWWRHGQDIQLNPGEVDVLAPRHVQLQQVGLLRHITQHDGLQNTDPGFNILEQSLNAGFSGYEEVDFEALEEVDFEALEDLDNNRAAPGTAPMDEHMQEVDNDTGGTQTDSSEDWTPNAKSKKAPTRKRKRAPAMNASKSSKRSRSKRVGSTETANATSAPPFPTVFYKKS
ncbi:MAG: hypothetical protein NXY57DRAFT_969503 [Lentinula lateritia]|nr:MAG: hypothetical protein NXY57DRAFT_969503 [Lentinula lateritia]